MNTRFLLIAQYNGAAIIPIHAVCRDYFSHLTPRMLMQKITLGEIKLPIVRVEPRSQKAAKGVHLNDLAKWIDDRRADALRDLQRREV